MVRNIILALLAFSVIALLALWILMGGPRKLYTSTKESIVNAVPSTDGVGFRLPWQPVQLFPTLDISDALLLGEEDASPQGTQARIAELESEYERLSSEVSKSRTFGSPSPYAGKITIVDDVSGVRSESASGEYVQISAAYSNTAPIDVTGWTLESALSSVRVALPPAAAPFITNSAYPLVPLVLDPGALALVGTALSPIGVSFRENMCSGYLGQFQSFDPPLAEECPAPSQILPLTEENLRRYGDGCFEVVQNLSLCRFPQNIPDTVSSACRTHLTEYLSYNGCVNQHRSKTYFHKNMWRVFLGSEKELWRNSHDAIRLLDAQGKTVSVFVY